MLCFIKSLFTPPIILRTSDVHLSGGAECWEWRHQRWRDGGVCGDRLIYVPVQVSMSEILTWNHIIPCFRGLSVFMLPVQPHFSPHCVILRFYLSFFVTVEIELCMSMVYWMKYLTNITFFFICWGGFSPSFLGCDQCGTLLRVRSQQNIKILTVSALYPNFIRRWYWGFKSGLMVAAIV